MLVLLPIVWRLAVFLTVEGAFSLDCIVLGTFKLELLDVAMLLLIVLFADCAVYGLREDEPIVLDVFKLTAEGAPSKLFLGLELDLLLKDEDAPLFPPPIVFDYTMIYYCYCTVY